MFTITEDIHKNIQCLEEKYNFKTKEFVDKINQHLQTLSPKKSNEYVYYIREILSYNINAYPLSTELQKENILFLISQILNLKPDIKLLEEINATLNKNFSTDDDFEYITHYLEDNDIRSAEHWNVMLDDELEESGIKTSSKEIEEIREMDMESYYQYTGYGYEWLSPEDMIEQILTSILLVQKANKGENFLILNNCGEENLKYLQDQGVDTDKLIHDFINVAQSLKYLQDKIRYLTKVNTLFNKCRYQEQTLKILLNKKSQEDIDNLNSILEKDKHFLDKFVKQIQTFNKNYEIKFLKGSTIRDKLDIYLKNKGTNSKYMDNDKVIDIIENIKKDKWYWVDENGYPYEEMSEDELVEQILNYLIHTYKK
ncbi:hypothetical protein [Mycoplasma sp. 3686d]|uniref:hypothetical protein n=1 Tax=Mycoplasma sp. 3686d TaxID=2967300 RepID=UPI00211C568B|nr:hypothetical protein [Mycoplasma sp. 3686d]UUM24552.1 hypothetical protein NPA12_02520 [Mycoplasma sp. 3686d]